MLSGIFILTLLLPMTIQQFLYERSQRPTFLAEDIYKELRRKDALNPTYSKDLITVINYLQVEGARFPAEQLRWLTNKIVEMASDYVMERERQMAVVKMAAMMNKALPPADERYIDYEQSENK